MQPEDLAADGTARLTGRRQRHAREVLRAQAGDVLEVGLLHGSCGEGRVLRDDDGGLVLEVSLGAAPPPRPGVDLVLAVPRPKALKKVLPAVASLGVDTVVLVNAARVEKSYFQSHVLAPASVAELFALGLEQARDTVPPTLLVRERFRPFVEDELDRLFPSGRRWVAHPGPRPSSPVGAGAPGARRVLALGPEGGWVPFELELLAARGFVPYSAGPRPLRVEVALPFVLGALLAEVGPPR